MRHPSFSNIWTVALLLGVFALIGSTILYLTRELTQDQIIENQRQSFIKQLSAVLPTNSYDNDLLANVIILSGSSLIGSTQPITIYRAEKNHRPVAVIFPVRTDDGYNGEIALLLGVWKTGQISGVAITEHKETPGLGDGIEKKKSDWLDQFYNKSLAHPGIKQWAVEKDGGAFDQLTGATVTPRAVIKAIKNGLLYFQRHQHEMFPEQPTQSD